MRSSPTATKNDPARPWAALVLLAAVGPLLYAAGSWGAALIDDSPIGRVDCFDAALPTNLVPTRVVVAVSMAIGATLLLVVVPWFLGAIALGQVESKRATAGAWSLAVNSVALILVCLVLRNTVGIDRVSFLAAWLAWTCLLLWLAGRSRSSRDEIGDLWRRWRIAAIAALATAAIGIALFYPEQFIQCFEGDGDETYQLAHSLQNHFLPYWEMEWVGRFGTDVTNPSLINSYWTFGLQVLLGEGEIANRLPFWIWWTGILLVSLHMVRFPDSENHNLAAVPLGFLALLVTVWYSFYTGWDPYMADLANPGVTDALFTLFLLLALDCLLCKDLSGWIVMMAMGSLVLYAGPVMFVLTAAAALIWQPVPRAVMLRATIAGALTALAIAGFYLLWGWLDGSISGWWLTIYQAYVEHYIRPIPRLETAELYGGYFLLGCGGVGLLGLLRPFRKIAPDQQNASSVRWERTAATVILVYLLIVLTNGVKNLHYLGPLLPVPVVLWLRTVHGRAGVRGTADRDWRHGAVWLPATATVALAGCLWLCWPASRNVFTLHRALGAATTFQTDSYQEACLWLRRSDAAWQLYDTGYFGWYIGQHNWIHHSQLAANPTDSRPLVVTDGPAPSADYRLVRQWDSGLKLYCRDEETLRWIARQRPPSGPDRCPWVFQPIAIAPFPRSAD